MLRNAVEDIWTELRGLRVILSVMVVYHAAASAVISIAK
jgi:hypothetical protein